MICFTYIIYFTSSVGSKYFIKHKNNTNELLVMIILHDNPFFFKIEVVNKKVKIC